MAPEALNKVKGQVVNKFKDIQDMIKAKKSSSGSGGGGGSGPMAKVTGGFKKVTAKISGMKKGSAPSHTPSEAIKNIPRKIFGKSKKTEEQRCGKPSFGVSSDEVVSGSSQLGSGNHESFIE
jgi:hypothetical protein